MMLRASLIFFCCVSALWSNFLLALYVVRHCPLLFAFCYYGILVTYTNTAYGTQGLLPMKFWVSGRYSGICPFELGHLGIDFGYRTQTNDHSGRYSGICLVSLFVVGRYSGIYRYRSKILVGIGYLQTGILPTQTTALSPSLTEPLANDTSLRRHLAPII